MRVATIKGPFAITAYSSFTYWVSGKDLIQTPGLGRTPINMGDFFVCRVSERMLDYDEILILSQNFTDEEIEVVNRECDFMLFKGGNYIKSNFISERLGYEKLSKIKIPIILLGVGMQADLDSKGVDFDPEEEKCLKYIHDNCKYSAVRGNRTAEQLHRIGIQNTMVTGCPVLFWSLKPTLEVRQPSLERVGFGFRKGLYCQTNENLARQFQALDKLRSKTEDIQVFLQGEEIPERNLALARKHDIEYSIEQGKCSPPASRLSYLRKKPLHIEDLREQSHKQYADVASRELIDYYLDHSFFSLDLGDYLEAFQALSLMTGFRLHGNLLALSQGVPCVFWVYDQRTLDICETLSIPFRYIQDVGKPFEWTTVDYSELKIKYSYYYGETRRFLDLNGLKHNLQ